jgi:hypothetical protein
VKPEAAHWTAEFAKTGEVRVPPRRRVTALKTLLYGFLLANEIGAVVSAALGRQNWLWWPLFCLVAAPLLIPLTWVYVRMALFSRPVLVVDKIGMRRLPSVPGRSTESARTSRATTPGS